jgi:hypothetical protein
MRTELASQNASNKVECDTVLKLQLVIHFFDEFFIALIVYFSNKSPQENLKL